LASADPARPASQPLLALEGVDVFYGAIHALRGVSLVVYPGEVVTLIGANGAGKSTTLRAITGLLAPRSGQIRFEGSEIGGTAPHALVGRGISMSPEGRGVFANLTVLENLEMGAYLTRDKKRVAEGIERSFTLFPRLLERRKQAAGTLSGGEQQMLAMARALMSQPRLLLLDEPSLGLSPILCQTIFGTIDAIKASGTTVLLVEQNANAALKHADRAYVLETGAVTLDGAAADVAADPRVREAYLGE
jgi:branched-chain amino acid transport system ATP-binding protein